MTKVLFALTASSEWQLADGSTHFGGVWSPEFVFPHDRFSEEGYDIVVATPGGRPAPIDPASLNLGLQENDEDSVAFQRAYVERAADLLRNPAALEELDPEDFDLVFVPGGFGVYEDLSNNAALTRIVENLLQHPNKVVATLCSGASALLTAKDADGNHLVHGRKITGFPNSEMTDFGVGSSAKWLLEDRLKGLGADYVQGIKHHDFHVVDGNLISGQNGASSKTTAALVVKVLSEVSVKS